MFCFEHAALLLIDIQPDFLPGGGLAVSAGDSILGPVRALMERGPFSLQLATQDWHPRGHVSFASSHPGKRPFDVIELYGREQVLWPDHCLQGSPGAELHPSLPWREVAAVLRKGTDPAVDSYSGFRNNWDRSGKRPATGLGGYLREREVDSVFICGLARDVCVKWTAEDAAEQGFSTQVIWELTRPVDAASDDRVRSDFERRGVRIVELDQCISRGAGELVRRLRRITRGRGP